MKRGRLSKLDKFDMFVSLIRQRSVQILIAVGFSYALLMTLEIPFVIKTGFSSIQQDPITRAPRLASKQSFETKSAPTRPLNWVDSDQLAPSQPTPAYKIVSNLSFDASAFDPTSKDGSVELHKSAKTAWLEGRKLWQEIESGKFESDGVKIPENRSESCPHSISLSGSTFSGQGKLMVLPCGLTLGSHITVVGKPRVAHAEKDPKIALLKEGEGVAMVSQFMMELQGLNAVEGEEPPKNSLF